MGIVVQVLLAVVLVAIPVGTAVSKGRELRRWLAYSIVLWPVAFAHALILEEPDDAWY